MTFAGTAANYGVVRLTDQNMTTIFTCRGTCAVGVATGTQLTLVASTPLEFSGWAGDCTGTGTCNLGTIVNPRSATVTFGLLAHQIGMIVPPEAPRALVYSGADLVIGDPHTVTRMKTDGSIVYRRQIPTAPVRGIATDASGNVYALTATNLTKLAADGTVIWVIAVVPSKGRSGGSLNSRVAVSSDGTVIAVQVAGGVRVFDDAGAERYAVTNLEGSGYYVVASAIAPDKTVAVAAWDSNFEQAHVHHYAVNGTAGPESIVDAKYDTSMVYDSQGNLHLLATGSGQWSLRTSDPAGVQSTVFPSTSVPLMSLNFVAGLATTSDDHLVAVRWREGSSPFGLHLEVWTRAGVLTWSVDRPTEFGGFITLGIEPSALATDQAGHVAVGATYPGLPMIALFSVM
ncbi:MAG: hypothetical protein IPQ07_39605 [Myxococcales bacterium]|nr:hypothetical protein [Myxococcales bacterium]